MGNIKISQFANKAGNFVANDKLTLLDSQDAYSNKNKTFLELLASFSDFASTIRTEIDVYSTGEVDALLGAGIVTKTADYVVLNSFLSGTRYLVNCNTADQYGQITITLPDPTANAGKWLEVEHGAASGLVKITGNGASELYFKQNLITSVLLYMPGSVYKFFCNGLKWTMSGTNCLFANWKNQSDYTDVTIGNGVTYDNGSGTSTKNTDWTGMVVTEATSGFTGVVVEDTGGVGVAGILYLYNLSTGFTFFTNNRKLTASNGQTIDVNEISGTSKNIEYQFRHEFGVNEHLITHRIVINSTASFTNCWNIIIGNIGSGGSNYGISIQQIGTLVIVYQTGQAGILYFDATGAGVIVDAEDWYINQMLDFSC